MFCYNFFGKLGFNECQLCCIWFVACFKRLIYYIKQEPRKSVWTFVNWLKPAINYTRCCQRVCVWLVALARTKLIKENEPEEIPKELPSRR